VRHIEWWLQEVYQKCLYFLAGSPIHSVALACALAFFAVRLLADFFFGSGAEDEPKKNASRTAKKANAQSG